jgi:hypothetical protein
MSLINNLTTLVILLTLLFFANSVRKIHIAPPINISLQEKAINIDTSFLKVISFGNPRFISSLLWIKTLLDGDLEHYKGKDLNSWMFLRFKAITELDPNFYEAYLYGGLYLSIVKDDDYGAKYIYDRGIYYFPNDYELLKNIAFHYHFELDDILAANEFYKRLMKNPLTPIHYRSLYARFSSEQGDHVEAFNILHETYQKLDDKSAIKKRLHNFLYAIKAETDLKCLNSSQLNCNQLDFNSNPYIKDKNNLYISQLKWEPFRLRKK